jgi:hypothetical protein
MGTKNINDDIGELIIDGRTHEKTIVLLSEEGLASDMKKSIVLPENSNEAETVERYGSNKADDQ